MPAKIRNITAIYMDDAFQASDDQALLESFIRQWAKTSLFEDHVRMLGQTLLRMKESVEAVWQTSFSDPPHLKKGWISALSEVLGNYVPLARFAGLHRLAGQLELAQKELGQLSRSRTLHLAITGETQRATQEALGQLDNRSGDWTWKVANMIVLDFRKLLTEAEEMTPGWGERVRQMFESLRGSFAEVGLVWTRLPQRLKWLTQNMPYDKWKAISSEGALPGKTVDKFMSEFFATEISTVASFSALCDALRDHATELALAAAYVPGGDGGAFWDWLADMDYTVRSLQAFAAEFGTQMMEAKLGQAMSHLDTAHRVVRQAQYPRSAKQLAEANRVFSELDKSFGELDRQSLVLGYVIKEILRKAELELQDDQRSKLEQRMSGRTLDLPEVQDILEKKLEDARDTLRDLNPIHRTSGMRSPRTASFDPSILGRSKEEIADMDAEEKAKARKEDINRVIDLLNEIGRAYDGLKGSPAITKAITALKSEAR